jgi:hypothetical protein
MKYVTKLSLIAAAAMAVVAVIGAASASATTLAVGGAAKNSSVEITGSLASGTSSIFKDEFGTTTDTCAGAEFGGKTEGTFTGSTVGGKLSFLAFGNCTHITKVDSNGSFSISWDSGTNGTFRSAGAEITMQSTFFGATCLLKTGTGTALGTVTGVKEGHATLHIDAFVNGGICGLVHWTGTYTITSPTGLGVEK